MNVYTINIILKLGYYKLYIQNISVYKSMT